MAHPASPSQNNRNRATLVACVAAIGLMVGAAYAASPLYRLFCKVTGYGGTTQVATSASDSVMDRTIKIRLDANVSNGLNWKFQPEKPVISIKIGETATVFYHVENHGSADSVGVATYNVQPDLAGSYFNKLQCFCFSDLKLKPGESLDVPVVFFVDPAIVKEHDLANLDEITLSYTFFPAKAAKKPVAELTGTTKPQL
jgi:cytochrome c oxidase assembly protein subunit 11